MTARPIIFDVQPARPRLNSYWVTEGLMGGEYPGDRIEHLTEPKLRDIVDHGITLFLDLTEPHELTPYHPYLPEISPAVRHERVAIRDVNVPSDIHVTRRALALIGEEITAGGKVYVHCWGGVGRTGLVIGCWLVDQGLSGESALQEVQRLYATTAKVARIPRSPETDDQRRYVLSWSKVR